MTTFKRRDLPATSTEQDADDGGPFPVKGRMGTGDWAERCFIDVVIKDAKVGWKKKAIDEGVIREIYNVGCEEGPEGLMQRLSDALDAADGLRERFTKKAPPAKKARQKR